MALETVNADANEPRGEGPRQLGRYTLMRRVGLGGMGEVWKGKFTGPAGFEKVIGIKKLLTHLGEDPEFAQMFVEEAKLVASLSHPNIVQVLDFGFVSHGDGGSGEYFIAMDYVAGQNVGTLLNALQQLERKLPVNVCLYIVAEAAKALAYAHRDHVAAAFRQGIVHRDVSPPNVLVSFSGDVRVTDFGIAKMSDSVNRTSAGMLRGKIRYMSPEQAKAQSLDHRADIFSLGLVLFELLKVERFFDGDNSQAIHKKVCAFQGPSPEQLAGLPPGVQELLTRALSPRRENRYQTATEFQSDILGVMGSNNFIEARSAVAGIMNDIFRAEAELEMEEDADVMGRKMALLPSLEERTSTVSGMVRPRWLESEDVAVSESTNSQEIPTSERAATAGREFAELEDSEGTGRRRVALAEEPSPRGFFLWDELQEEGLVPNGVADVLEPPERFEHTRGSGIRTSVERSQSAAPGLFDAFERTSISRLLEVEQEVEPAAPTTAPRRTYVPDTSFLEDSLAGGARETKELAQDLRVPASPLENPAVSIHAAATQVRQVPPPVSSLTRTSLKPVSSDRVNLLDAMLDRVAQIDYRIASAFVGALTASCLTLAGIMIFDVATVPVALPPEAIVPPPEVAGQRPIPAEASTVLPASQQPAPVNFAPEISAPVVREAPVRRSAAPAPAPRKVSPPARRTAAAATTGSIKITARPWAEVWIDGRRVSPQTPFSSQLKPGTYELTFVNPHKSFRASKTVRVVAGKDTHLFVDVVQGQIKER